VHARKRWRQKEVSAGRVIIKPRLEVTFFKKSIVCSPWGTSAVGLTPLKYSGKEPWRGHGVALARYNKNTLQKRKTI